MGLAKRPRIWISLATSAALYVLYLRVVPDIGSYVLRVSVARMGSDVGAADGAGEESSVVALGLRVRGLDFLDVGSRRVYFVVILVWGRYY